MTSYYNMAKRRTSAQPSVASEAVDASHMKVEGKSNSSSTLRSTLVERPILLDDDELAAMAMQTKHSIDWSNVGLSARAGPARWHRHEDDSDFSVYTRHETHRFDVLAVGVVPGCVAEILNVLQSHNGPQYAQHMGAIFENQFRDGAIVHHGDMDAIHAAQKKKKPSSLTCAKDGATLADLTVKRMTFNKASWLANHEEWCYADAVYRSQQGGPHTTVEKFMTTMQPKDVIADTGGANSLKLNAFHDVVCAYRLCAGTEDPPAVGMSNQDDDHDPHAQRMPRTTRVSFYSEYHIPKQIGFSFAAAAFGKGRRGSSAATDKTIKQRLLKLAQSTSRLTALVRRQRLGLQALVDASRFLPPTNTPCNACDKMLLVAKLCRMCGQGVCKECSEKHERARQPAANHELDITRIRVCVSCMHRIDRAEYENLTSSSLLGTHLLPDPVDGKSASTSLKDLLEDALLTASSRTRKSSVKSVIKCMLDQESASQRRRNSDNNSVTSDSGSAPLLTPMSSDMDYVRALGSLEVDDNVPLRSDDHQLYQLDMRGSDAVPTPVPDNEVERLQVVCSMNVAELSTVSELEILCTLAAREMGCTTSVIGLIKDCEYFGVASNVPELRDAVVPRTQAMCSHTMMDTQTPLLVAHPESDIRFSKFDSVDKYGVRFYCAFPLLGENDQVVGSMCCINSESLEISGAQLAAFQKLASIASKVIRVETQQQRRRKASLSTS